MNRTIEERVATLESKQENSDERFDRFVENDFDHVRKKVDWIFTLLILTLGGLVANLVLLLAQGK